MPKFAFIGAGSFGFTRNLVRDILTFPALAGSDIYLMDIDKERLDYIKGNGPGRVDFAEIPENEPVVANT